MATHQALADELGSVRVFVSRMLRSFEERGWVRLERERVTVIDARALAEFAQAGARVNESGSLAHAFSAGIRAWPGATRC